jgi:hypothetical protein
VDTSPERPIASRLPPDGAPSSAKLPGAPRSHRALIVAAFAVLFWSYADGAFGPGTPLQEYTFTALASLSGNEAAFYLRVAFVQIFFVAGLGVWLAPRWGGGLDRVARRLIDGRGLARVGVGAVAAALALFVAIAIVRCHTITEDEKTYLFQAKLLLLGKLTIPVPAGAEAFWEPFLVAANGHWSGQYFWAQPALLALGLAAHATYLVPAVEVACTVVFTRLLVDELTTDRRAGALAAVLVATSPIVVMTGGTLLNANLSAACGAASLYAVARIGRGEERSERAASVTLALATAIGLHNRVLDEVALLAAAGAVLFIACGGSRLAVMRRLLPAVAIAIPLLALQPLSNAAVSGDWRHSGYWLHHHGHDWISFGFGRGPGDFPQNPATAAAKTIANGVRMLFYASGGPLAFAPVAVAACLPDLIPPASRALLRAGAWTVCLYYTAYFFYASAPITVTGPVYFDALVPVLAGSVAIATLALHDALSRLTPSRRRLVPAFVLAQTVAGFVFFWPGACGEVGREAKDAAACDDLVRALDPVQRALVFVAPAETYASWTFWRPMPSPRLDDRVLFARTGGAPADATVAARFGADRAIYFSRCVAAPEPTIERYDPASGRRSPIH